MISTIYVFVPLMSRQTWKKWRGGGVPRSRFWNQANGISNMFGINDSIEELIKKIIVIIYLKHLNKKKAI